MNYRFTEDSYEKHIIFSKKYETIEKFVEFCYIVLVYK